MLIRKYIFILLLTSISISQNSEENKIQQTFTNSLINESSSYLIQHAYNPINWYPWGKEALEIAKRENKLIIISIGYSACHWCHVMEEESFRDIDVAKIMNDNFIAIKVDREERPDIDQVYMNAVQLLTGSGGWPLNCVALPDGRPIYGGTYFTKDQWINMLNRILQFYNNTPHKTQEQADLISQGIEDNLSQFSNSNLSEFSHEDLDHIYNNMIKTIDFENGGFKQSPKFPLPNSFEFLLNYHYLSKKEEALKAVELTLKKIAFGGIYDHIGGGFARYSTDEFWKIPHFEKMLYDNAQLVSLYSKTYQNNNNSIYKDIVYESLEFIEREMTSTNGGFHSSIDADSEGEEGKFYIWTKDEIKIILDDDSDIFNDYYNISKEGNWENDNNIIYRSEDIKNILEKYGINENQLSEIITKSKQILFDQRSKRTNPPIDSKVITSWNALMLMAYIDAYSAFDEEKYLKAAIKSGEFLLSKILSADGKLNRIYNGSSSSVNAFLDDYAFTINAFISLYQATFDEKWLHTAKTLNEYALTHFFDDENGMFYYTSDLDEKLFTSKIVIHDSVIPSSNSQMAINLFILGHYFYNDDYINISKRMLSNVKESAISGSSEYSNWDFLMSWFAEGIYEVAIVGEDYQDFLRELNSQYLPNIFLSGGKTEGTLSLHEGKFIDGQTTIYVCKDKACRLPVTDIEEALKQIN